MRRRNDQRCTLKPALQRRPHAIALNVTFAMDASSTQMGQWARQYNNIYADCVDLQPSNKCTDTALPQSSGWKPPTCATLLGRVFKVPCSVEPDKTGPTAVEQEGDAILDGHSEGVDVTKQPVQSSVLGDVQYFMNPSASRLQDLSRCPAVPLQCVRPVASTTLSTNDTGSTAQVTTRQAVKGCPQQAHCRFCDKLPFLGCAIRIEPVRRKPSQVQCIVAAALPWTSYRYHGAPHVSPPA